MTLHNLSAGILCLVLAAVLVSAPAAHAQDDPQPKKYENVDWHSVVMINFKAGKSGRALEIIRDHFLPSSEESGTPTPIIVELKSGEWDLMMVWTMKGGPGDMEWETSPEGVKWRQALNAREGGPENADKLYQEYISLVQNSTSYVGLSGKTGVRLSAAQ